MSAESNKIEVKGRVSPEELVGHLHALADSFATGRVVIEQGGRFAALEVGERAELEIEAEEKKGKCKLSLSVSWRSSRALEEGEPLRISAEMPDVPQAEDGSPIDDDDDDSMPLDRGASSMS